MTKNEMESLALDWYDSGKEDRQEFECMISILLAAAAATERNACKEVCQEQSIRFAEAMNGKAAYGAGECEKAISARSNAEVSGAGTASAGLPG